MNATRLHQFSATKRSSSPDYVSLALKVLSEISSEVGGDVDEGGVVEIFCTALTKDSSVHRHQIVSHLHEMGLTNTDIIDEVIPAAARRIGEQWVSDELTFAEVTCSAARMQEMSRFLGTHEPRSLLELHPASKILLIVPKDEQHTMGVFVAADQFRRQGLTVEIAIGQDESDLKQTISDQPFAIFGISAASNGLIDPIRSIVDILKDFDETIPVALGGNILRIDADAKAKTNVDIATSSPFDVARLCTAPMLSGELASFK